MRLPKPYGRRRGERVQQLLRQLRQREQQRRLVQQQRITQLQLWRLQQEFLQQQQQQQGSPAGEQQPLLPGGGQVEVGSQQSSTGGSNNAASGTIAISSSSRAAGAAGKRSSNSSWLEALRRFSEGVQQEGSISHMQKPHSGQRQQPAAQPPVNTAVSQAAVWEQELQAVLQTTSQGGGQGEVGPTAPAAQQQVVIAVVPVDQVAAIEAAWQQVAARC